MAFTASSRWVTHRVFDKKLEQCNLACESCMKVFISVYLNFLTCPSLQDLELAVFSAQSLWQEDRINQDSILTDFLNEPSKAKACRWVRGHEPPGNFWDFNSLKPPFLGWESYRQKALQIGELFHPGEFPCCNGLFWQRQVIFHAAGNLVPCLMPRNGGKKRKKKGCQNYFHHLNLKSFFRY